VVEHYLPFVPLLCWPLPAALVEKNEMTMMMMMMMMMMRMMLERPLQKRGD
jgi:hypothetical protein